LGEKRLRGKEILEIWGKRGTNKNGIENAAPSEFLL
jgi:hypothetical protein